jgi:hypothetical protein
MPGIKPHLGETSDTSKSLRDIDLGLQNPFQDSVDGLSAESTSFPHTLWTESRGGTAEPRDLDCMSRIRKSLVAAFLCLLVWPAMAPSVARAEEQGVRVYTNADLERFPVLPDSDVEASRPSADEWRFVTDYLQRQYTRLDADREYSLERERAEAEVDLIRSRTNRRTYSLPGYWNRYDQWNGAPDNRPGEGIAGRLKRATLPSGSIRPLHAGPTRAQVDYFKATRRSGADAVPSNSRSGSSRSRKR